MSQQDDTPKTYVDITPTPQGLRAMREMFEEQQQASQAIVDRCEEVLMLLDTGDYVIDYDNPEVSFLTAAVEAYASQERTRIASMQEGLDELARCGY